MSVSFYLLLYKSLSIKNELYMASFDFNPIADYVVLKFKCPECGTENETDALSVPTPDFAAENHRDSCNYDEYEHECSNCGHIFDITINNGIYGGDGEISDVDDVSVEEEFPEDDYYEEFKSYNSQKGKKGAPHIVSASFKGVRSEVLLHALEDKGIYISAGSACSSNRPAVSSTLKAMGIDKDLLESTVRFSFCEFNTEEEVDYAVGEIKQLLPILRKYVRR